MLKAVLCLLLFLALTFEDSQFFGSGLFHTPMVYAEPFFRGNPLNAWDLSIAFAGLLALFRAGSLRQQVRPLNLSLLLAVFAMLALTAWGALRGGDLRMAYFQLSALLRMFLLFPVLLAVFRTLGDLRLLALTVAAAALYRAVACILSHRFFLRQVGLIQWPEYMTDHHDSVLWVTVVIGALLYGAARLRARTLAALTLPTVLILLAVHYNDRRLAWLQLASGLLLTLVVMPRGRLRRRLGRWALLGAPLVALYLAVGWHASASVFAPVRQVRSLMEASGDESNRYRELENAGLVVTLQRTLFLGTGFGHPFEELADDYSAGMAAIWAEYRFIPHNSLLGLVSAAGVLGFPAIWAFLPVMAFLAARSRALARRPLEVALSSVGFAFPLVYGLQAVGDMGLQSFKANVLLACSLAATARLSVLSGAWPTRRSRVRRDRSGPAAAREPATSPSQPAPPEAT